MKKQIQSIGFIFSFSVLFFASCVNHDYDLDNEKIDKNVVLSPDGMNIPIGNLDKLFIFEKLNYDAIQVRDDGLLYSEYTGRFDPDLLTVPEYDIPPVEPVTTRMLPVEIPSGSFNLTPFNGTKKPLLSSETVSYEITKPEFDTGSDWEIDPKRIEFEDFTINVNFDLRGFSNISGTAKLNLYLAFPSDFEIQGETLYDGRIRRELDFNTMDPNATYKNIPSIKVKSYTYPEATQESDLIFDLELAEISNFMGEASEPWFQLTLITDNGHTGIKSISGKDTGTTSIQGKINGPDELRNSLGEDALLQFENPSLLLGVTTNLGADFRLNVNELNAHNGHSVSLTGNDALSFIKPETPGATKTTTYFIAPDPTKDHPFEAIEKRLAINELFATLPELVDYDITMSVNETNAIIHHTNLMLEGDYKLTLPFNFDKVNLQIKVPPIALGDNLYEQFFQKVKEKITIQAKTIHIALDKSNTLKLTATVKLLDAQQQVIPGTHIESVAIEQDKSLLIDILKEDLEKVKEAHYLELIFTLEGTGISLTKNDYIEIQGLRFISDGGVLCEFEL